MEEQNIGIVIAIHCPSLVDTENGYVPACTECGPLSTDPYQNIWTEIYAPHIEAKVNEFLANSTS